MSCQVLGGTMTSKRNEQNKEVVEAESFLLMLDFAFLTHLTHHSVRKNTKKTIFSPKFFFFE